MIIQYFGLNLYGFLQSCIHFVGTIYNRYIEASLSRVINRLTSDLIKNQSAVVVVSYT